MTSKVDEAIYAWYERNSRPRPIIVTSANPLTALYQGSIASSTDMPDFGHPEAMQDGLKDPQAKAARLWAEANSQQYRLPENIRRRPLGGNQVQDGQNRTPTPSRLLPIALGRLLGGPDNRFWRAMWDAAIYGLGEPGSCAFIFHTVACVSQQPVEIKLDGRGRPHCETGPAIIWNGWQIWAYNGRYADEEIVLHEQTLEKVLAETNAEIRQVRLERFGLQNLIHAPGAKTLDEDVDGSGLPRKLVSFSLPDDTVNMGQDREIRIVVVGDPAKHGQEVFLRVPPNSATCKAAVAWTFGYERSPDEYAPTLER